MSIQDQLLKSGLVDKHKSRQEKSAKRKRRKQAGGDEVAAEIRHESERKREQKVARDRELNKQQQEAAQQIAIKAQIAQLITSNVVVADTETEERFSFTDNDRIKDVAVDARMRRGLTLGQLAVVKLQQAEDVSWRIVPAGVAQRIAQWDQNYVAYMSNKDDLEEADKNEDDPYAAYQVPDDLMW